LTSGHPVIMGRTTYESIGKVLPGRTNIIITRNEDFSAPGCKVTNSIEEAIREAREIDSNEIFIIGGGQVYEQGIKHADKLYLTLIDQSSDADTFFPDYSDFGKIRVMDENSSGGINYKFLELTK
jgi:dihydrofolate reductase